ncbi:hypothetical protein HJC23_004509 [Cyclotella cryptica]|uniref:Uncharacterized protein n=1 Tax=Cyclotella cryptica TaxID=29204 RepID=A0ABD3PT52_9STRA
MNHQNDDNSKGLSCQNVTCLSKSLPNPESKSSLFSDTEDDRRGFDWHFVDPIGSREYRFKKKFQKFHVGSFQCEVVLIDNKTDHPKNRRIYCNDNDMEWLSLEEIKQIDAYHDKISVRQLENVYQLSFLPLLKASMVEEARLPREDKFNPKLAPTRMQGSPYYMRHSKSDWTLGKNHHIVSIPDHWFHPTERETEDIFYRLRDGR